MADCAVKRIDALCECEGCGKRFGVELDTSESLKGGHYVDFDDMVRWYVRGGNVNCYTWGVRGKSTDRRPPMSEFGHSAAIGPGFCIDSWGVGPFFITDENGKQYCFEDSDRFGPSLLGKKGDPLAKQPGERSPFWRVHSIWVRQGRRTEDGKNCIWDEPKPQVVRMIGKRHALVVEAGEENGRTIILPSAVGSGEQP